MKLLSLRANKPSFHPIVFKDGINIIVGKQVAPLDENDGNTYNGCLLYTSPSPRDCS